MSPDEIWEKSAACIGKPAHLFEYHEEGSPIMNEASFGERTEYGKVLLDYAMEVCIECPVMILCGEKANQDDKEWTVRGGEYPDAFTRDWRMHQAMINPSRTVGDDRVCVNGHLTKVGTKCADCNKDQMIAYRLRLKTARGLANSV